MTDSRHELYLAVAQVAATYGAENVTSKRVAQVYGRSEALIYRYCKDKKECLKNTFEYARDIFLSKYTPEVDAEIFDAGRIDVSIARLWRFYIETLLSMSYMGFFFTEYTELITIEGPHQDRIFLDGNTNNVLYDNMCSVLKERVESVGLSWDDVKRMISDHTVMNVLRALRKGRPVTEEDIEKVMEFIQVGIAGICEIDRYCNELKTKDFRIEKIRNIEYD